jgi:hypothetical protein
MRREGANLGRKPVSLAAMGLDDIVVVAFVVNLVIANYQSLNIIGEMWTHSITS